MNPVIAAEASELVIHVINEFVVHDYLDDGVWECFRSLRQQVTSDSLIRHFVLTAEIDDELVGTIEIRDNNHICMFCVEKEYRRRGIGRTLLQRALEICIENNPNLSEMTVNSLPGAVYIYERLGFHSEIPEHMLMSLPYTPMHLDVSKLDMAQSSHYRYHHYRFPVMLHEPSLRR